VSPGVKNPPMCECEQGPRIAPKRGCAECEGIDHQNRDAWSIVGRVLAAVGRLDAPQAIEIATAAEETTQATRSALGWLVEQGKIKSRRVEGLGVVYRTRRAA
jgi:hypothetical protein